MAVERLGWDLAIRIHPEAARLAPRGSDEVVGDVVHIPTSIKVDLFVVGGSPLDRMQLVRRQRRQVSKEPVGVRLT